jgi:16S rRNA processing protein RimM
MIVERDPDRLAVGRVLRPHGVRGELVVESYSELFRTLTPSGEVFLGDSEVSTSIISIRPHRKRHLIRLKGCSDRAEAERFRNQEILIEFSNAAKLPDGVYYHWQIIGLKVLADSGQELGEITEILETGANDVYIVRNESGDEILLPAIEEVILEVDHDSGQMRVHLLPGMLA